MNLCLLLINLMTVASISGVPHNKPEHPNDNQKKNNMDRVGTISENKSNSDRLYKKEWDSYWESYYRNLMNKLNAHTYRGKKRILYPKLTRTRINHIVLEAKCLIRIQPYFVDPKRSGKISQNYRSDSVEVDESTKLLNELLSPFESIDKRPNISVRISEIVFIH